MKRVASAHLVLVLLATPALAADTSDTATGTFKSQSVTMEARSAVAFRGKSFLGEDTALIVAVTNAKLKTEAIADYVDRKRVLETRVKDAETGIVYFEFRPDGSYRGMSYYFGSGNGCGHCTGEVVSDVKLVGGKVFGKLTDSEKDRSFAITLVAPIVADEHGLALPADGGEPGKAYLLYHNALANGDRAALRPLVSKEQQQFLNESEKNGKLAAAIHSMAERHPVKSLAIRSGFATGIKAVLLFTGESSSGKVTGEALLVKEGGAWRVDDEIVTRD